MLFFSIKYSNTYSKIYIYYYLVTIDFILHHTSNDARREGVTCFVGCAEVVEGIRQRLQRGDCFQQLLQYASPGCAGWMRAYALISSRTPRLHIGSAALPARGPAGEATLALL